MKSYTIGGLAILVLVLVVALLFQYRSEAIQAQENRATALSVNTYVAQHISDLSPEEAVLGGKFYVTEVSAKDGVGVVHYEDGHIALVADFTYELTQDGNIIINSFDIRK